MIGEGAGEVGKGSEGRGEEEEEVLGGAGGKEREGREEGRIFSWLARVKAFKTDILEGGGGKNGKSAKERERKEK